jgi:O-antigen/teichoic acid export membrane protein
MSQLLYKWLRIDPSSVTASLARNGGKALVIRVLWAIVSYLIVFTLGRWLTKEDFGVYVFINNIILMAVAVATLGRPTLLLRFVAEYRVREQKAATLGLMHQTQIWVFGAGIIVFLLCAGGALIAASFGRINDATPFLIGFAAIPFVALLDVYSAALRGFRYVVRAMAPRDLIWRLLVILAAYGITLWSAPETHLIYVCGAVVVSALLLAAAQGWFLEHVMRQTYGAIASETHSKEWNMIATPMWIAGLASALFRTSDVIVLGFLVKPELVALYFAGAKMAELSRFFLIALNTVFGPMISSRYYAGKMEELRQLGARAAHFVFWPSAFAAIIMILFPTHVLSLMGPNFGDAATVLIILSIARVIDASFGCIGPMLNVTGHQKAVATALITTGVLTLVAQVLLTMSFGILGAAIATAAGIIGWNLWLYVLALRRVGIDPSMIGVIMAGLKLRERAA